MNADQGLFLPAILGVIEGLTEFLPVSSTAHLLLAEYILKFSSPDRAFEVLIQFGAVLAIITVYFVKLATLVRDALTGKAYAWRFVRNVFLASLPAAVAGVLLHDFIKSVIYESPSLICATLILGGIVLLFIDRLRDAPKYDDIYAYPWSLALAVGIFQMLALIPGVSRSGATIVGARLFGADRRSATEFTFFIALPVMAGAFGYDFLKNREAIMGSGLALEIAIGLATAFIAAALVVRSLLAFVERYGFAPFGWWRIIVGIAGLGYLAIAH